MGKKEKVNALEFSVNKGIFTKTRLKSLYSDFTSLFIKNPEGFLANVNTWREAIETSAWSGKLNSRIILVFDETFESAFSSPALGRPLSLGAVAVRELSIFFEANKHKGLLDPARGLAS